MTVGKDWLRQMLAAARTETRLQVRRRGVIMVSGFLLIGLSALTLLLPPSSPYGTDGQIIRIDHADGVTRVVTLTDGAPPVVMTEDERRANGIPLWLANTDLRVINRTLDAFALLGVGTQLLLIALAVVVIDTLPLDRQVQVREVLTALPLHHSAYLVGKVIGTAIPVVIGTSAVLVLTFGVFAVRYGPPDVGAYAAISGLLLVISGGLGAALAVIVGGFAPTRRAALLFGVALIPVLILWCAQLLIGLFGLLRPDSGVNTIDLTFPEFIGRIAGELLITQLSVAALVLLLGVGLWAWERRKEYR